MASITLTVADDKVPLIQAALQEYNEEHGTSLTVQQWIKRLVAAEVLKGDIAATAFNLRIQKDAEFRAALEPAQDAILGSL